MRGDREISNTDNILDSRDVIARFEYLDGLRDDCVEEAAEKRERITFLESADGESEATFTELTDLKAELWITKDGTEISTDWLESDEDEYQTIKAFNEEGQDNISDWTHGETLIAEDYFEDYAQQLAEDLGMLKGNSSWPYTCIDWEKAADELKMDYSEIDFGGNAYLARS